jgi:translation initiation factor RLI1
MNTFNPMQIMSNMIPQRNNGMNQFFGGQPQQKSSINQQQMISAIPNLNKNQLSQLVMQARAQGMTDDVIEQGLNFLLSFK